MKQAPATVEPVSVAYIMREISTAGLTLSAGFPSPAADDIEEPVDLIAWMIRHNTQLSGIRFRATVCVAPVS